jgi:hypothetical protein
VIIAAIAGVVVVALREPSTRAPQAVRQTVDAEAPPGVRIRVEVLNATRIRGLARRATMHLRDRGFDVVSVGTSRDARDSTLVLDRSGHPDWAELVATALGGARVETAPDSSRYLDVTVLVGTTWLPPAEPFYP